MISLVALRDKLDRRLQLGPGMRFQRVFEALFLVAAFFTGDLRFAYVTFASTVLQALSPRLVPIALLVSAFVAPPTEHRLGDLYFDLAGTRGACVASTLVLGLGIWAVQQGYMLWGYAILAIPTASFILAPTVGFCCGCTLYVLGRDALVKLGWLERRVNGARDVDIRY